MTTLQKGLPGVNLSAARIALPLFSATAIETFAPGIPTSTLNSADDSCSYIYSSNQQGENQYRA